MEAPSFGFVKSPVTPGPAGKARGAGQRIAQAVLAGVPFALQGLRQRPVTG